MSSRAWEEVPVGTTGRDTISGAHDPDFILREDFIQTSYEYQKSIPFVKYCILKTILANESCSWLAGLTST